MILKNSSGKEKKFKLLLCINYNKNNYYIYEDVINEQIYCGKEEDSLLVPINDLEYELVDKIYESLNN